METYTDYKLESSRWDIVLSFGSFATAQITYAEIPITAYFADDAQLRK